MLPVPASSKGSTRKISFQPTDISDVSATTSADSSSDMRTIIESKTKQVLREVLENQPTGRLLFQIGPYTITDHSIHFLNSTLSDEVIDVFLHLMPKKNVYHIDSINMTSIFEGDQESTGFLNKIPLHQYDALIGAVNENQVHWVLMIVVPDAKCLVYINPMCEPRSKCDKYRNRWTAFLRERSRRHIGQDALTHDGWEVQTVPHDKQTDGSSCGVYVIRFADLYFSGEEMDRCWTSQDIKKERLRLQLKLLSLGINAEVPLQDPSRLEMKQALDEFSESPREGLDMTARMNQTTNDVDLPDLEVPVAPVEWSSLESEQDQESIMEKHQRKGNLRQKRPKDVFSKKGQKRLQKIKEKNETLVQFLLSKEVKAYLLKIMQGKQASNLHTISTGMSQRARRAIKHSGFGPIDDDEQIDRVVEGYIGNIQELKLDTMKHIDYVFDVWVPEAIMMFYKKKGYSKAKAEEMFNKGVTRTKEEM
ncbi:uncharacterized protein LOC128244220 [Mya arenaria]|uniref:uncharacterized protein LOC128244220 n=1 Tax=Mya arenaria TaxID=6604 RepID=UPI0022E64EBC|nr:uncharacterized protein LOC128244220 [Mya arenaria]